MLLLLGFEVCVVALVSSDVKLVNGTSYFLYSMFHTLHTSSSKFVILLRQINSIIKNIR